MIDYCLDGLLVSRTNQHSTDYMHEVAPIHHIGSDYLAAKIIDICDEDLRNSGEGVVDLVCE